ncbi:MAG: hypothetical protein HY673_16470 [Chloroflexi bacterium]|nr:hypothetical protein [Chloroflexota bacterium]
MPISKAQFNEGSDETRYHLFRFLKDRSDEAFTVDELVDHLKAEGVVGYGARGLGDTALLLTAGALLDDMVRSSFAEKKIIAGKAYFSFRPEHSLARLATSLWMFY